MITCGCGKISEYEVYEHRDPHCFDCMMEAVDNKYPVLVRKVGKYVMSQRFNRDEIHTIKCDK